jgi:hypothetical protein
VVNGVMYLLAAGNQIMALDAATGKETWRFSIPDGDSTGRGLAYWPGDRNNPERVMFTASAAKGKPGGARLVALDAATGKPSEGFGTNGIADIGVPWNGVPLVFKERDRAWSTVGNAGWSARRHAGVRRAQGRSSGSSTTCRGRTVTTRGKTATGRALGREHLGLVHDGGRAARHPLYADRGGRQLLGRRSARQQSVRELDGCGGCRDRQVQVASDGAPRSVGLGHAVAAALVDIRQNGRTIRSPPWARPATCSSSIA